MEEKILPKLLVSREEAEEKIQERIDAGKILRDQPIDSDDEYESAGKEAVNWSKYNRDLLIKLFESSAITEDYRSYIFENLDLNEFEGELFIDHVENYEDYVKKKIYKYREYLTESLKSLEGIRSRLELFEEPEHPKRIFGDKIFIVHGHDEGAKHKVARFIGDLDLTETILDEQPGQGQTMIEKFEEHADEAGLAIVLLTADDIGAPKDQKDNLQPRARQNVILELGYFIGLLGRKRICLLYEEGVELPSDIKGLEYVPLDNADGWKIKLAVGMRAAGFTVDLNRI